MILRLMIASMLVLASCTNKTEDEKMNSIAEDYVNLALRIGQYDQNYIDAYYGPESWKPIELTEDQKTNFPTSEFLEKADDLIDQLSEIDSAKLDELSKLRYQYLSKQIKSMEGMIFYLSGKEMTFDEESRLLYDATAPSNSVQYYQSILDSLDSELPGEGSIYDRYNNFRNQFVVPVEKLESVFNAALEESRTRTIKYIELPAGENFSVEYVTDKPWGAYNWYQGNYQSLIQVNKSLPIYIDRIIDLASHEGYPGHHVYNLLLEKNLLNEKGWKEFSVYLLYSPHSLIAEGTANFGINIAYPDNERIEFESKFLFPLAGFNPADAEKYYKILRLTEALDFSENEAARNYIDGKFDKAETIDWLKKYSLMSQERAENIVRFIETYRSYIINYNVGKKLIKDFIENSAAAKNKAERWKLFERLLSTPQTPSGLLLK